MAFWLVLSLAAWGLWALLCRVMNAGNPREDEGTALLVFGIRLYARFFHRMTIEGGGNIPNTREPGALIVVGNHTAGVDPFLVQAATWFEVRWMMGLDMMIPALNPVWAWADVIGVNREGKDMAGTREAMRHVKRGKVLGIFPEGRIERPAGELLPFAPGAGFLIARSKAPVLPVWISGTPQAAEAWGSLYRRGRVRLVVGPLMHFPADATPESVVQALEAWFRKTSGW